MSHIILSVVMGVYNGAEQLAVTLSSVLRQEGASIEFIVIDDGSTDQSKAVLDEWVGRDSRLRVIHQANAGLTRALIRGCNTAEGEFIARQDCGDVSLPGRLSLQLAALQANPSLSFVSCGTRYATQDGEFLYEVHGSGKARLPTDIIDLTMAHGVQDGPAHHGSVMFRRSAYEKAGGYRPEFYYGQDWDLWYRLAEQGKFQLLPETLYEARIGVGDISMNNKARQELIGQQSLEALRLRLAGLSDQPALDRAALIRPGGSVGRPSRGTWRGCYFMGECLRRNGNREAALRYLGQAIRENPVYPKAWLRWMQAWFA
jgi:glycosyltransferase involved in cell wall biosynthesis